MNLKDYWYQSFEVQHKVIEEVTPPRPFSCIQIKPAGCRCTLGDPYLCYAKTIGGPAELCRLQVAIREQGVAILRGKLSCSCSCHTDCGGDG